MLTPEEQQLVEKHYRLGIWISGQVKRPMGYTPDEWVSECLWCLVRTVQHFDPSKGKFQTLLWRFVKTHRHNIVAKQQSRKRGGQTFFVSLDEGRGQSKVAMEDLLATAAGADQVELLDFANWVYQQLDAKELRILEGMVNDDSFSAIGAQVGVSRGTANDLASMLQHKIADKFPWETDSRPKCSQCQGPILTRTKATYCGRCLYQKRCAWRKHYEHARGPRGRKAVAV